MLLLFLNVRYHQLKSSREFQDMPAKVIAEVLAKEHGLVPIDAGFTYLRFSVQGWTRKKYIFFDLLNEVFVKGWE